MRGSPCAVCVLLQQRDPAPGCPRRPALPPSSTDPRGVAGAGPGDGVGRGAQLHRKPDQRPREASGLRRLDAQHLLLRPPCPWPRALDPHPLAQGPGGGAVAVSQVAAHRTRDSGCNPCLSLAPSPPWGTPSPATPMSSFLCLSSGPEGPSGPVRTYWEARKRNPPARPPTTHPAFTRELRGCTEQSPMCSLEPEVTA